VCGASPNKEAVDLSHRSLLHAAAAAAAGLNKKYVTSQLSAAAAASATAQEVLAGIRTVKSFAKEQQTIDR
jgi:ABC-type bacteriocin/lantibiotic exporter with double-glycine peptidase domain